MLVTSHEWGLYLELVLFNIFNNELDKGLEGTLSKFVNDDKLEGIAYYVKGRETLQSDLDKLEGWEISNCIKFNDSK